MLFATHNHWLPPSFALLPKMNWFLLKYLHSLLFLLVLLTFPLTLLLTTVLKDFNISNQLLLFTNQLLFQVITFSLTFAGLTPRGSEHHLKLYVTSCSVTISHR